MKVGRLRASALTAFAIAAIATITFATLYRINQRRKKEENWYEKDIFNSTVSDDNCRA